MSAADAMAGGPTRYGAVAIALHWIIALSILGLMGVGVWMTDLKPSPRTFEIYALHKSAGLLVLALAAFRLIWRVTHRPPALPASTPRWQAWAAGATHAALYALMLALPITGWLQHSAAGYPLRWFGLFKVPALIGRDREALAFWQQWHEWLAWALAALILLHVAAALKHHFLDRDGLLGRMWPARATPGDPA
jgi:cytochrome b561